MYAIKTEDAFYIQDGVEIHYQKPDAQPIFFTGYNNDGINYVVTQTSHWSGVFIDGTGNSHGVS